MKKIIKKTPIPISGLMLGLAGLGNIAAVYGSHYKLTAGMISAVIALIIICRFFIDFDSCRCDLENPIVSSVILTFPMAVMLLSTYLISFNYELAKYIWYSGIIIHLSALVLFSYKFFINFDIKKIFPSNFIVHVGIVVASVTAPAFNNLFLGKILFYFGFISYMILLPIVFYRVFKIGEIKDPELPTISIFTAPAGLCLAGYMSSFADKNIFLLSWLVFLTLVSITAVTAYLPKMLSLKFYPSYSALTFPFVITAVGLKLANKYLSNIYSLEILKYPALATEILSIIMVSYVLIKYSTYLFNTVTKN
jgi:exfoliative toxin A/B